MEQTHRNTKSVQPLPGLDVQDLITEFVKRETYQHPADYGLGDHFLRNLTEVCWRQPSLWK